MDLFIMRNQMSFVFKGLCKIHTTAHTEANEQNARMRRVSSDEAESSSDSMRHLVYTWMLESVVKMLRFWLIVGAAGLLPRILVKAEEMLHSPTKVGYTL